METKFNKEQVCELDEKALVNAFEVEELEKRYEMGWAPDSGGVSGGYSQINGWEARGELNWNFK